VEGRKVNPLIFLWYKYTKWNANQSNPQVGNKKLNKRWISMYLQSRIQEELEKGKSQLHAEHLVNAQALAYAEVQHDLLASTRDSVGTNVTVQALNLATLTTAAVA
jgi:hypothetical protein